MLTALKWIKNILGLLFPSLWSDKLASALLVVSIVSEFFALWYWRWNPSFNYLDLVAPVFLLTLVLRVRIKHWVSAPLLFLDTLMLLILTLWFSFSVPSQRLLLCVIEAGVSLILAVRYGP